ncbi:MAG: LTA synthase family protein [Muribaculaceae bacterium]|nr:LTA synthase family protein [Muribaculaceae bacterium]
MKSSNKKSAKKRIKNPVMWFFILAVACIIVQLFAVEYQFNKIVDFDWLKNVSACELCHLLVNNIADATILMLPFVALSARWRKWSWIVIWIFTLWCLAQLLYMPTYRDLMPMSSFLLVDNMGGTVARSTIGAFKLADLEVLLPPILLYIVYRIWFKRAIEDTQHSVWKRLALSLLCILVFAGIRLGMTAIHYHEDASCPSYKQQFINDYYVLWTRQGDYLNQNGAVPYIIYGTTTSIFDRKTLTDDQKQEVTRFINEQPQYTDDYYASARGKNVILLVVESLNSWAINLQINGQEVTPTLNALCNDTVNNLVTLKMKSQVKNGRSSDGIFMYNTGLLPLTTQAVANTYGTVPYPTLANSLGEGYDTFYACCDEPALWNVKNTSQTYGYSNFYGKAEIHNMVKNNGYLVDKALLEEVSNLVPKRKKPFFALVATAGMHHPYNQPMEPTTWIQSSGCYTKEVRCYLECANAFDTALAQFIENLKSQGLYDNTMIVIVSDHNEMIDDSPKGRPSIDLEGDNCVFLAINSGQSGLIDGPIGQIDIYPTLMDLLGLNFNQWKGLGLSILRNDICSVATSPNSAAGDSPLLNRQKQAWRISDMIITSRWYEPNE